MPKNEKSPSFENASACARWLKLPFSPLSPFFALGTCVRREKALALLINGRRKGIQLILFLGPHPNDHWVVCGGNRWIRWPSHLRQTQWRGGSTWTYRRKHSSKRSRIGLLRCVVKFPGLDSSPCAFGKGVGRVRNLGMLPCLGFGCHLPEPPSA